MICAVFFNVKMHKVDNNIVWKQHQSKKNNKKTSYDSTLQERSMSHRQESPYEFDHATKQGILKQDMIASFHPSAHSSQ